LAPHPDGPWPPHSDGLTYAAELVRLVRSVGDFCVGVARPGKTSRLARCGHGARVTPGQVRGRRRFRLTQMSFFPEDHLRLQDRVTAKGGDVPVIPGTMPITSLRMAERAADLGACRVPERLWERPQAVADDRRRSARSAWITPPGCASGWPPTARLACTSTHSTSPGRPGRSISGLVSRAGPWDRGPDWLRSGSRRPSPRKAARRSGRIGSRSTGRRRPFPVEPPRAGSASLADSSGAHRGPYPVRQTSLC
jgi:hypothetical protein